MRKDQYLLIFGIGCILAAIIVYSINHFACEEKESRSNVIAISQASMYGLQSYRSEIVTTIQNSEEISTTSTKEYVAPDRYHGKSIKQDEWLEYIFIGNEQYYRASYGTEWRENGIFYKEGGSRSQIFMQISDDFRVLSTLTDVEKLSDEKIDGVSCFHYQEKQYPEIDIEAEMEKLENYLAENPELMAGTDSMSIDEIKELSRASLERSAEGETIIDLWIGRDDYFLRQMKTVMRSIQPGPDGEDEWVTTTFTTKWSGFNEPIEIVAPEVEWTPPEPKPSPTPAPTAEPGTSTAGNVPEADLESLVAGNTGFGLDLYNVLKEEDGNLFFSPYSISTALAMTWAGARGETEQQMAEVLHFSLLPDQLHPAFNSLDLQLTAGEDQGKSDEKTDFTLRVANSLWGEQSYTFLPEFLDLLAENYGAGMELVDFKTAPETARIAINDWVSDQTEEKIKDLIPQGAIDPLTRLVLANAIYFYADWVDQFDPNKTHDAPFHLLDGEEVTVPMMSQLSGFPYTRGSNYQAVELEYVGNKAAMTIIVPDGGVFSDFEANLTASQIEEIISGLESRQVQLTLPKFTYESEFSLKDAMVEMGMTDAFGDADFSGMDGTKDLFISGIFHKAFVAVDEEGTEAAAATAVVMELTAAPLIDVTLSIDRPFIYLIRDTGTNTIQLLGRVLDPSK